MIRRIRILWYVSMIIVMAILSGCAKKSKLIIIDNGAVSINITAPVSDLKIKCNDEAH